MNRAIWIGCFFYIFFPLILHSQSGVIFSYSPSKIIIHSKKILFDAPPISHEFRLGYYFETTEDSGWASYWHLPTFTLNAIYTDLGNPAVLGRAYAILPEIHFPLFKGQYFVFDLRFGTGIAYLDRPYHPIDNPENNAIGSCWNNISNLKFGIRYHLNNTSLFLSGGIVHYSNGRTVSPNLGINLVSISLGAQYRIWERSKRKKTSGLSLDMEKNFNRSKYFIEGRYIHGFTSYNVPGGPSYIVRVGGVALGIKVSEYLSTSLGLEYEYNDATFSYYIENYYSHKEALAKAKSMTLYIDQELRYGWIYNRIRLGWYIPGWSDKDIPINVKLVTGTYLPFFCDRAKPYIGFTLKFHKAVADFLGLESGIKIRL